jgi:mannose-1-phosphate guanylyltransferase/mannose-6-phosphate isomerase
MPAQIVPVIMCGGTGTRPWPVSRESKPKQFVPIVGSTSTFQQVLGRVNDAELFARPIVITNADFRFVVAEQLRERGIEADIVLEPVRRDSGLAVAISAVLAAERNRDALVLVLAADHIVRKPDEFREACRRAATNSGNFLFHAAIMLSEIERFEPAVAEAAKAAVHGLTRDLDILRLAAEPFARAPKKSIDYAVMERTKLAAVVPTDIGWSDIGSWSTVWDVLNFSIGQTLALQRQSWSSVFCFHSCDGRGRRSISEPSRAPTARDS